MLTQNSFLKHRSFRPLWFALLFVWLAAETMAQTTAFTYQGKLTVGGNPASGDYDLQFRLFDALTDGKAMERVSSRLGGPFPPDPTRSRLATLYNLVRHSNEMYGYMAVYLRLKGVVPPTSAPE